MQRMVFKPYSLLVHMTTKKTFYVTTAIDYVNSRPHIGHAFEKTLADTIARWHRLQGEDVFFLTGVDENAQKNVEAAAKAGVPVKEFIDRNTKLFQQLCEKLNLSNTEFVRTTAKKHEKVVHKIIKGILANKKDIYKGAYKGLYCVGCEAYYTEKDLIDGKCPEHNTVPELREEEAYFFKLSTYEKKLLEIIPKYVIPQSRANEILSRIKEDGLQDICISRKGAKWGIDLPVDKDYKIWVWIDALINYISGLEDKETKYWPADVHIIGKGINWFHSVIWPAILLSAGYKLPRKLLVHGYLNVGGQKMSKSLGNVIDTLEILNKYNVDTVRYSLLRNSVFEDSEYSEELLIKRNDELADKLGNLISRVSTLAEKYGLEKDKIKELSSDKVIENVANDLENLEVDKALNSLFEYIGKANEYAQHKKPWETKDKKVIYELVYAIKELAILLSSFLPSTAEQIATIFNFKIDIKNLEKPLKISKIKKAPILFKKIETNNIQKTTISSKVNQKQPSPNNNKVNKTLKIEGVMSLNQIKYDDFAKLDLRVATIKKAEDIEGADKLYKLEVDLGTESKQILAGIKQYYSKEELKGKQVIVIANLEPRKMKGLESQGMLLAASSKEENTCILISPEKKAKEGTKIS